MRKLFIGIVASLLASCASAPQPPAKSAVGCIHAPPPNITGHKLTFLAPPRVLDKEHDATALIVEGKSFVEFTLYFDALTTWADKVYDECRDPHAPPASEVGSTVERKPDEDEK